MEILLCMLVVCCLYLVDWCWVEGLRIWPFDQIRMHSHIETCFWIMHWVRNTNLIIWIGSSFLKSQFWMCKFLIWGWVVLVWHWAQLCCASMEAIVLQTVEWQLSPLSGYFLWMVWCWAVNGYHYVPLSIASLEPF